MYLEHPDIEALVSLQFGELPADRTRAVRQHLAGCALCRQEFERLQHSLDGGPADCDAAPDSSTLLATIRDWEISSMQAGDALKRRIAIELAPYVGQAGADTLLRPVQDDGRNLLSKVAPMLTVFLGRRAAGNLVSRVVEKTIVGRTALCES